MGVDFNGWLITSSHYLNLQSITFDQILAFLFVHLVQWPEWSQENIRLYVLLLAITPILGLSEWRGWSTLAYSKFRTEKGMSSRAGMFILYFVPMVVHVLACNYYTLSWSLPQIILSMTVFFHFFKRSLESLFLHKYAGPIGVATVFQITFFYASVSWAAGYFNQFTPSELDFVVLAGLILFIIGVSGNYIHHKILADLRKTDESYFIPQKGLFRWVSCPHYFFELIGWLGMAFLCKQPFMYLTFWAMAFYLMARSIKVQIWYRTKFPDYPTHRKALIPIIF